MMATAGPLSSSSLLPLLESLEDSAAGQPEHTDAYLTIANRLSGEEGRQFLPAVEKHFSRLGQTILKHITSPNAELSQAALQALGFCVYHGHVVSGIPDLASEILLALCSLVLKSTDKNTCTRALWVISKQSFPPEIVAKKVPSILSTLENVWTREDIQSVVMEHEALNVVIRLLEQVPPQMGDGAVRWAKLVIPLVVHSASKVRLRAAAAMEMGMPLLLEKQMEVAAVIEPIMSTKLIPELQKLFMSKNEANVLKLWPLFVRLLGKLLHRGGPFINSLLHLEELGFRSSSPNIKKIAFIAWKSLIDNFALNPDILSSAKRMKLLMQPLSSIHVRTEALLLTKLEVWWYLVVRLGPNLAPNFEQVSVPLLQCTIGSDSSTIPGTPARGANQNGAVVTATPKTGSAGFNSPVATPRMSLNSSIQAAQTFPSIQLLGLEMLLHYFLGPEVVSMAAKNKLLLSLEPLTHPFLSGISSFTKHAAVLISTVRDGFIAVGKEAPDSLLALIWKSLVGFVNSTIESVGSKKDRQGCEVLTLTLQALQSIVSSEALPADRVLVLFEMTVKGIPQRVLGSASYQVGKMDVLNGTPALFLILLFYNSSMLSAYVEDERFFQCLHTLVGCGLSGPTSPLAFGEAVLGAIRRSAVSLDNKEQLWRMWSVMVSPLIETITQSNEVNQGDALEHNFNAVHSALMLPVTHLLPGTPLQQGTQKSMLITWSKLYKVFARCSALVVTAEENVCCEELCVKMAAVVDKEALMIPATLDAVVSILQVMVECVDFSPYTPQFQKKMKSPHTPLNWIRKKNKALGNLSAYQSLLLQCLDVFLAAESPEASSEATGLALVSILSTLFTNLALPTAVQEAQTSLTQPLTLFYKQAASEPPIFSSQLVAKLEKLLGEVLGCLQTRSTLVYDDELLAVVSPLLCVLFPHKNKQLRTSVTQFWNNTFANSVSLNYPDELRPILSQVKQKTPIILPGFEAVSVPDELSGQYSQSESSQLETKLSGVLVSSVGKRDSLLGRAAELKDRSSKSTPKPVSTKLDFGSPLPPRREVLEEEASIDFVFIPPETKERVLTEHQKEVKRTKRVDIPAMYNNLDASLDTTVFTQYTQSQEDSLDKLPTEQAHGVEKEASGKGNQEDMEVEGEPEILSKETQDYASPKAADNVASDPEKQEGQQGEIIPESADVSMEDDVSNDVKAEDLDKESKESTSPNISSSSDLISGTPQKPSSRRQSFITLEKYSEGKPASPSNVSTFTGPHTKASSSQEHTDNTKASSQTTTDTDSQVAQASETGATFTECCDLVSPDSSKQAKVVPEVKGETKLAEGLSSERIEDEDDVIPDTQTDVEGKNQTKKSSTSEEIKSYSQGDEPEDTLEDSQCSPSQSSLGEPRRSGRQRVRPLLPGEDPEEREEKYNQQKKRRSGEEHKSEGKDRQVQGRPNTRSKQAAEEESGRLRTRSRSSGQMISPGKAQRKSRGYSNSQDLLGKDERKRRSTREDQISQTDSQTDTQSDNDSQSQSRRGRRSRSAMEAQEESRPKQSVPPEKEKEESSQTGLEGTTESQSDNKLQVKAGRRSNKVLCNSQELDLVEPTKKEELEPNQSDSQIATPSSQTDSQSQVRSSRRSKLVTESEGLIKDKHKRRDGADEELSQDDSQVSTPSASDSLSQNRLRRRSKAASGAEESEDKNETKDSLGRQDKSDSQAALPAVSQKEGRPVTRGRRSKIEEEQSQSQSNNSPSLTPVSSQSLNIEGSTESSQSRSRYSRRRSSQALLAGVEASESDSSDNKDDGPLPKRRGPRAKVSLSSPLSLGSGEIKVNEDTANNDSQSYQKADVQSTPTSTPTSTPLETKNLEEPEDSPKNKDMQDSKLPHNIKEQNKDEIAIEVELDELLAMEPIGQVKAEIGSTQPSPSKCYQQLNNKTLIGSPRKIVRGQRDSLAEVSIDQTSSQENDTRDSQATESLDSVRLSAEQFQEKLPSDLPVQSADGNSITDNSVSMEPVNLSPVASSADTLNSSGGTTDKLSLQVSESSEEKGVEVTQPVDVVTEKQKEDADSDHPETPNAPMEGKLEDNNSTAVEENQLESQSALDEVPEKEKSSSVETEKLESQESKAIVHQCEVQRDGNDTAPEQKGEEKDNAQEMLCEVEEQPQIDNNQTSVADKDSDVPLTDVCDTSVSSETISKDVCQDSPAKQKDLEAMIGPDVGQSPIGGRTRGTWSPSASPSTSILKKGQKRPLEEETPSPLVKSRRVSFADPIQHQELADDIDRRSPVIRTSSPKRSKTASGIPQPKYVTTPTKGLLILSPRNLRSPGSKSSKKCLISEMSQEPRPIPKDCVYPALVGCSTPVEAVLPQISSNMWPRGFGQLVRARNIKTVGDLSALTPGEIKTLPIRSPKISNVKKALKTYHEQQRKGRGGADELKSFDEMEKMTSEVEENNAPQNQDEEDKLQGEPLATELVDEPVPVDQRPDQDGSVSQACDGQPGERRPEGQPNPEGLLSQMEALSSRVTPLELNRCSPQQLLQLHDHLGGMMRSVVVELQTRLCQTDNKP
ncbi:telomere-associated protein RIF1 isoform X3 [Myripristis murdjan]|uniref:telomere-associated protein RIF1 isoform X3 n=1 Tax=Myripristis murdjan TaxID=586833 RepID=UPI001175E772|nr:telomere-associated protein RIF1 isoform X3 [Myripristis murdjan]